MTGSAIEYTNSAVLYRKDDLRKILFKWMDTELLHIVSLEVYDRDGKRISLHIESDNTHYDHWDLWDTRDNLIFRDTARVVWSNLIRKGWTRLH